MVRLRPSFLLLFLAALSGQGCSGLFFDRQGMILVFPKERPEIQALVVYEGLRVVGGKPDGLTKAKTDLSGLVKERQELYLILPLFHVYLQPSPKRKDEALDPILRRHLTIDRAEVFLRPDGRLCAVQEITVRDPDQLIAALNGLITAEMVKSAREKLAAPASGEQGAVDRGT